MFLGKITVFSSYLVNLGLSLRVGSNVSGNLEGCYYTFLLFHIKTLIKNKNRGTWPPLNITRHSGISLHL